MEITCHGSNVCCTQISDYCSSQDALQPASFTVSPQDNILFINTRPRGYKTFFHTHLLLGRLAQLVMCLTADPGDASSIPARSDTFVEIDQEIISVTNNLPSADSRRVVVSYKRKYEHKVLVNGLVKLAQEKSVFR